VSEASQIIVASNNLQLFNLIKKIIPAEYKLLDVCSENNELFKQLIRSPENYSSIIISPSQDNMDLLRKITTCSKTKSIPVILETTNNMSIEEINTYVKAGTRYCLPIPMEPDIIKSIVFAAISDRKRYLSFEQDISAERSALIMNEAIFKFQLLEDCQSLATLIANACPNPKLAVIGIAEILINAVEHGNLGISYVEKTKLQSTSNWFVEIERRANLPENKNKYVTVSFLRNKDHIKLHVKDEGNGFEWDKFQYLDSGRIHDTHGRGIIMAKNLAFDQLEYLNKGNEVNCYIKL
jgi:anti-sigma regulatory factor (Ser/Thr protein kinase)